MKYQHFLAAASAAILLAACGGGGGSPATQVGGTAATGAPLAGASIELLCAAGGSAHTATANAEGKYALQIPETCAAPYFVKATAGGVTLHAFADAAANINVTPFTELVAGAATQGNTAAEYAAVRSGAKTVNAVWSGAAAEAKAKAAAKLEGMGIAVGGLGDWLHGAFSAKAGDKLDDALEALKTARGTVSLASLVEQMVASGGKPGDKPWLGWFAPGASSLKYVGAGCNVEVNGMQVASSVKATVTLSLSGDHLAAYLDIPGVTATTPYLVGVTDTYVYSGYAAEQDLLMLYSRFRNAASKELELSAWADGANTVSGTPRLRIWLPQQNVDVECEGIDQGPSPSAMPRYDVAARVAAMAAGTPAISGTCTGDAATGTYSYAISTLGEVMFNGAPIQAGILSKDAPGPWIYAEQTYYPGTGPIETYATFARAPQYRWTSGQFTLMRQGPDTQNLIHGCGELI